MTDPKSPVYPPPRQGTINGRPCRVLRTLGSSKSYVFAAEVMEGTTVEAVALKLDFDPKKPLGQPAEPDRLLGRDCAFHAKYQVKGAWKTKGPYAFHDQRGQSYQGVLASIVRGQNLKKYLDGVGALPTAEVVDIAAQGARSLHDAHRQGMTHNDVKLENFMRESATGRVHTIDWEWNWHTGKPLPHAVGTYYYMAPEVVRPGAKADPKSDVYSFGLVVAELANGERARSMSALVPGVEKPTSGQIAAAIATDTSQPSVEDPHLQRIVQRATHPDARQRGTMLDLMTDLGAYPQARRHFDADDRRQVVDNLLARAAARERAMPELDAAAAHGLLADLPAQHPQRAALEAVAKLGSPVTLPASTVVQAAAASSPTEQAETATAGKASRTATAPIATATVPMQPSPEVTTPLKTPPTARLRR